MTESTRRQRAAATSSRRSSTLLIVIGTVVALVAGTLLVLQLMRGGGVEVPSTDGPVGTATASPATDTAAATTTKAKKAKKKPKPVATPTSAATSLNVPAAGISQPIEPQGLAADGTINPASGQVIWFTGNDRVEPGHPGTSVIAGHVTWGGNADSFYRLGQVKLGDPITIGYADGSTRSFTVTEVRPVSKDALARSLTVWGPHPKEPTLALVTCDAAQGYLDDGHTVANLLVVAKPKTG